MSFVKRNNELLSICKNQGEKIIEQSEVIKNYENKLKDIQEIINTNNYNNLDLQFRKIRKILNG